LPLNMSEHCSAGRRVDGNVVLAGLSALIAALLSQDQP
jgi:hypothetical protein